MVPGPYQGVKKICYFLRELCLFLHQILYVFTHIFCSIPVIITVLIWAEMSSSRTGFVSSFSRFSKISSPRNIRSDSTCSLEVYEWLNRNHPLKSFLQEAKHKQWQTSSSQSGPCSLIHAPIAGALNMCRNFPEKRQKRAQGYGDICSDGIERKRGCLFSTRFTLILVENEWNSHKIVFHQMGWFSSPHLLATTRKKF